MNQEGLQLLWGKLLKKTRLNENAKIVEEIWKIGKRSGMTADRRMCNKVEEKLNISEDGLLLRRTKLIQKLVISDKHQRINK